REFTTKCAPLLLQPGGTRCPQRVGNAALPPIIRASSHSSAIVLRTRRSTKISAIFFFSTVGFLHTRRLRRSLSIQLVVRSCSALQFWHCSFHRHRPISFRIPVRL